MAVLSKRCKPDTSELHNSLKRSLTNIRGLCLNFVDCESFLESNSPDILALCKTNLNDSIDSASFSVRDHLPLIRKDCTTHMHGLAVYVKEGLPLSVENSGDSYLCFRLSLLHSVPYFFFLYRSPSLYICTVFDSIFSNIDELLSISKSANVFVFGDFNFPRQDWLTCPSGTDRSSELCYNFLSQTTFLRWLTFLPGSQTVILSPTVFISSHCSMCSTLVFHPLENSNHVVVSVSTDFPSNSQRVSPFHRIAYDCSRADWDSLRDHWRDLPQEDIFKLSPSAAAIELFEWVQVGIDVYILHGTFSLISMVFSCLCC